MREKMEKVADEILKKFGAITERDRVFYELGTYGTVFVDSNSPSEWMEVLEELYDSGLVHRQDVPATAGEEGRVSYTRTEGMDELRIGGDRG